MPPKDFQECRNRARAIAVGMLSCVKSPRRNRHGQAPQGTGLNSVSADAHRQNGRTRAREDRGENRLIGWEFDGDIQVFVTDAERAERLDKRGSCARAILS